MNKLPHWLPNDSRLTILKRWEIFYKFQIWAEPNVHPPKLKLGNNRQKCEKVDTKVPEPCPIQPEFLTPPEVSCPTLETCVCHPVKSWNENAHLYVVL